MLPIFGSDKTHPVAHTAAMPAWVIFVLAATALCQTKPSTTDGTWSGSARCQIDVQGPGYAHHETHTWTLRGAPAKQGTMKIYAGTWSVSGQGSLQRTQGTQTLTAQWTTNASLSNAPFVVFLRASDGKLIIKSWHAQLRSPGGVTGSQKVAINGVVQSPQGVIALEAFEWAFPAVEDVPSSTSVGGSSTKATNGSVGPMQPGGSHGTTTCTWQFSKKPRPSAPAFRK
jgi:hypothetical protein